MRSCTHRCIHRFIAGWCLVSPCNLCSWKACLIMLLTRLFWLLFGFLCLFVSAADYCYWSWPRLLTKILPSNFAPCCQYITDIFLSLIWTLIMILYLSAWLFTNSVCDLTICLYSYHLISASPSPSSLHQLPCTCVLLLPSAALAVPVSTTRVAWTGIAQEATFLIASSTDRYVTSGINNFPDHSSSCQGTFLACQNILYAVG